MSAATPVPALALDWAELTRRNPVERIKREKLPYDLLEELPALCRTPYEQVAEEDVLRLQWLGLYHDKPKTGTFMLRVKLPGGTIRPEPLRRVGEISIAHGRSSGEITTRQDLQLHWIALPSIPGVLDALRQVGLTSLGACGDVLRNITGCPVAGLDPGELFDVGPLIGKLAERFGTREYSNLPRKHKWTVSACPAQCNAPEIHDVALVGFLLAGAPAFAVTVGGGLSTSPRLGRPLGVAVSPEEAPEVLGAILDEWRTDPAARRSRGKSRFKFLVDDQGPERLRERVEARLGRKLQPFEGRPLPAGRADHLGVHAQKQPGLVWIGVPVPVGLLSGEQMVGLADLAGELDAQLRFTREQNLVLARVPEGRSAAAVERLAGLGLPLRPRSLAGTSIGCTGNPHCNFAVGDTKPRLARLVGHLEARFGERVGGLRIHLDGCPHACGQHWVGDIGIQGTLRSEGSGRIQAYDVLLRGGLGAAAAIGRPVGRKVPTGELDGQIERLVAAWLDWRGEGRGTMQEFTTARTDEELLSIMRGGGEGGGR